MLINTILFLILINFIHQMTTAIAIEDVRREVKILKALSGHKHLVKFHDAFEDANNVYIVMEYVFYHFVQYHCSVVVNRYSLSSIKLCSISLSFIIVFFLLLCIIIYKIVISYGACLLSLCSISLLSDYYKIELQKDIVVYMPIILLSSPKLIFIFSVKSYHFFHSCLFLLEGLIEFNRIYMLSCFISMFLGSIYSVGGYLLSCN